MLLALGLVAAGLVLGWNVLRGIFLSNPWLNSAISAFFVLGVLACFWQVIALIRSVVWIETFARHPQGTGPAPGLLLPLATLLRSRGLRRHISPDSARSILESVAQRIDEVVPVGRVRTVDAVDTAGEQIDPGHREQIVGDGAGIQVRPG